MLYDADRVLEAASTDGRPRPLRGPARRLPRPVRPRGRSREAERAGIPRDWVEAAQRSPVYALINTYQVALPLHPEYRTMPMVWYIPPLSPVVDVVARHRRRRRGHGQPVRRHRRAAHPGRVPRRAVHRRRRRTGRRGPAAGWPRCAPTCATSTWAATPTSRIPAAVGMTGEQMYDMYRLLAIAKYDERYVIPPAHAEQAHSLEELATECSLDYEGGPGMGGSGPFGEGSGGADARSRWRTSRCSSDRQTSDTVADAGTTSAAGSTCSTGTARARPDGPVPAARPGDATPADEPARRRSRRAAGPAEPAAARLAERVAAARLPRRAAPRATSRCCATPPAGCRDRSATRCGAFLDHLARRPLPELAADYVATFDHRKRCCLYLTYFAHGDTRKRGVALLRFKQTYRRRRARARRRRAARPPARGAGVRRHRRPRRRRGDLLLDHRAGLELLRLALTRRRLAVGGTCVESVCATLPPLRGDERDAVARARRRRGRPRSRSAWRRSRRRSTCPSRGGPPDCPPTRHAEDPP